MTKLRPLLLFVRMEDRWGLMLFIIYGFSVSLVTIKSVNIIFVVVEIRIVFIC